MLFDSFEASLRGGQCNFEAPFTVICHYETPELCPDTSVCLVTLNVAESGVVGFFGC